MDSRLKKYIKLLRRPRGQRKQAAARLALAALRDERGGEVLEYALIAGLIVVGAVTTIGCVGTKVLARWNSVNSKL